MTSPEFVPGPKSNEPLSTRSGVPNSGIGRLVSRVAKIMPTYTTSTEYSLSTPSPLPDEITSSESGLGTVERLPIEDALKSTNTAVRYRGERAIAGVPLYGTALQTKH